MKMTELKRRELALSEANMVIEPLLRGIRRLINIAETARIHLYSPKIHSSTDRRVYVIALPLPIGNPLVLGIYVSTQSSRPVSPSQFTKRITRLRKEVEDLRGKDFTTADIVYVYVSPKRLTKTAYKNAVKAGILVAQSGGEAKRRIAKYLVKRYEKLLRKLAGRRIWGRVALFAYALLILASRLGYSVDTGLEIIDIVRIIETGIPASKMPPPLSFG
ncbi:hypothetical protein PYJP_04220 [Pyrofollis japonicus]|uniref:hypothetical protein n=1 Tax=Pyrofollis japonicus TaxID=3060460 RepID=UPI00295B5F09|nr:hypothetical protein [Pyrofollis japonicus]BEP17070.1 hypothetical protein PYJP_04220 [Pyrofollis japonicus]